MSEVHCNIWRQSEKYFAEKRVKSVFPRGEFVHANGKENRYVPTCSRRFFPFNRSRCRTLVFASRRANSRLVENDELCITNSAREIRVVIVVIIYRNEEYCTYSNVLQYEFLDFQIMGFCTRRHI